MKNRNISNSVFILPESIVDFTVMKRVDRVTPPRAVGHYGRVKGVTNELGGQGLFAGVQAERIGLQQGRVTRDFTEFVEARQQETQRADDTAFRGGGGGAAIGFGGCGRFGGGGWID
eukprot:gene20233-14791_t